MLFISCSFEHYKVSNYFFTIQIFRYFFTIFFGSSYIYGKAPAIRRGPNRFAMKWIAKSY